MDESHATAEEQAVIGAGFAGAGHLRLLERPADADPDDLGVILDIGRAVATTAPLGETLSEIARRAAGLMEAELASIVLLDGRGRLRFAAAHGLSAGYGAAFDDKADATPAALAMRRRATVAVLDVDTDPGFTRFREMAREEGYRAMVAVPLTIGDAPIGALIVYRRMPGPWPETRLAFLELVAAHVASAVRSAELIDEQKHELAALARVVRGLREQRQAHLSQLVTVASLLEQPDRRRLHRFVSELEIEHHETLAGVSERIHNRILTGLLLAEMSIARQRGVRLRLDRRSRLDRLPAGMTEPEAVSVISNLLDNALDGVAEVPASRRRITLLLRDDGTETLMRVRDWGVGLQGVRDEDLLRHGHTTKSEHTGTGLALVAQIAEGAGGRVIIDRTAVGAAFSVVIPDG